MSLKPSSVFVCGMCIFSIFIDGTPVTDVIEQVPTTNTADLSEELRTVNFTITNTDRIISTETRIISKMALDKTSKEFDASINLSDDIIADVRQESVSDESSLELHESVSRELGGESEESDEYTVIPHIGHNWKQIHKDDKRRENYGMNRNTEYRLSEKGEFSELYQTKRKKRKSSSSVKNLFLFDKGIPGSPFNPISDDNFGNKIFLFKKDFHPSSLSIDVNNNINKDHIDTSLSEMNMGKSTLFLFNDSLPDPSDNFHHSSNSFD